MPAFDTFLLQELLIFRPKKVKNYHENRHFVGVVPKLMAFSNTCHLLTLLLQDLLIFRPKKVMNCHKNWHLIGRIHKLNLSHFGLKQMKLKSIVFSRGRGVAGRQKGLFSTVVLVKWPSVTKRAVKKRGGKQVIRDVSVELST